ncbi:alpha/beta hydrolase [Thiotrichales bacterium 19X7-9]|nr:alpha/beta hydrolase [Thiotrichales bacterium 19X7-9]
MKKENIDDRVIQVSDGVKLNYISTGSGKPMIMLPGGGLSKDIFKYQIEYFSIMMNVIALDKRGHGQSEKVDYGYRLARFAKDLYDVIESLNLNEIILMGHSLGASMIYTYIDLFGLDKISKLIIIDEPACLSVNPSWSEVERQNYGAIYNLDSLHELTDGFIHDTGNQLKHKIVDMMTTQYISDEQKAFILSCMKISNMAAKQLYFNNICQDYRDVVRKINKPCLFITGEKSLHPYQSHQWLNKQVTNSQLYIFSESDGGNHFMFVESPKLFNQVVEAFLTD